MSNPNCPFCGCEIAPFREKRDVIRYSCRNPLVPNSAPRGPLCRELEAHNNTKRERDEAKEQNAKLRDIAERIFAAGVGRMKTDDWRTLRAEFDQLKEGGK